MALKRSRQNIILLSATIILCLLFCEITIRLLGRYEADGNFFLFKQFLRPYKCPAVSMDSSVQKYLSTVVSYITYDPDLGWTFRPLSNAGGGKYRYNADGIRVPSEDTTFSRTPVKGRLRIAIFGDSFTHGDEAEYNQTWGYFLQEDLKKAGVDAEVLNFGVCGYGMDQAYLRWKKSGRAFSPDIVIFGFQTENMQRNVNIIRLLYRPTDEIFFSKPRFIIESNSLKLLNVPCVSPDKLPGILRDLSKWDLFRYEYWVTPENYRERPWQKSILLRAIWNLSTRERTRSACFPEFVRADKEPGRLAIKIVEAFKKDVEASGSKFLVVYLPHTPTLAMMLAAQAPTEAAILKKLDEAAAVIHPEWELSKQIEKTPWRAKQFYHYSEDENGIVGQKIAKFILEHRN